MKITARVVLLISILLISADNDTSAFTTTTNYIGQSTTVNDIFPKVEAAAAAAAAVRTSPSWTLFASTLDDVDKDSTSSSSSKRKDAQKHNQSPFVDDDDNDDDISPQSSSTQSSSSTSSTYGFRDRFSNSGVASAAAMATAAVNAAVSMKSLEAPQVDKSYIRLDETRKNNNNNTLDDEGLPMVYDKELIQQYWSNQRGALNQRWGTFVGKAVPFLTKLTTLLIRNGNIPESEIPALSQQARMDLQELGPTFIKAGQMMSVRPDVLPSATLDELTKLQDSVIPFDTKVAVQQIESELGGPLGQFFTSISEEPIAAASLAQVYLATLNDGNETQVAVKVQRPAVLGTVSKDLYVLRRAAEVFQGLVERFAPQQRTNYVALLNEWAIGFYTELDFQNEAQNQQQLRDILIDKGITGVTVPKVYHDLCTRKILVSQWMNGKKLSEATPDEVARVTPMAQEAFLTQLFEVGFFHADPHPGNLLLLDDHNKNDDDDDDGGAQLALIDCGLMASISEQDRDYFINAVIHLANKDYASLVDDFIKLQILSPDSDRAAIIPLMDKALSPYVKGGGAKKYEEELRKLYGMQEGDRQSTVGGFQAMTQDALTVLNDIPFSIPPYFAILGRAIVTLEGVALTGNPNYGIIMEAYPFIARKLLKEDRPEIQAALQQVLYNNNNENGAEESKGLKLSRLLALLNNAAGSVTTQEGAAFVDIDAIPQDGITFQQGLKFLLSDNAESLRRLLEPEIDTMVDVLSRQIVRQGMNEAVRALTPPRPPALPFVGDIFPPSPQWDEFPLPILLPAAGAGAASSETTTTTSSRMPSPGGMAVMTLKELMNVIVPKLDQQEELFALGLADAATEFLGPEMGSFVRGESVWSVESAQLILSGLGSGILGRPTAGANANPLLNPEMIQRVVDTSTTILQRVRTADASTSTTSSSSTVELTTALNSLDDSERARLDEIVQEITQRTLERTVERMSTINRVL